MAINEYLDRVYRIVKIFSSELMMCEKDDAMCDVLHMGSLCRNLHRAKLMPRPEAPFDGMSVSSLLASFHRFEWHEHEHSRVQSSEACEGIYEIFWSRVGKEIEHRKPLTLALFLEEKKAGGMSAKRT